MNKDKYELIKDFIDEDGGLYACLDFYICWDKDDPGGALLDGSFEPAVLRQIADYIDEHQKKEE